MSKSGYEAIEAKLQTGSRPKAYTPEPVTQGSAAYKRLDAALSAGARHTSDYRIDPVRQFNRLGQDDYKKYFSGTSALGYASHYNDEMEESASKAEQAYKAALEQNRLASRMTFAPGMDGFVLDELSAANMNINPDYGKRVSDEELARLYKEWQTAEDEARQGRSAGDYWKTMRRFNNNADAVVRDFDRRISEMENNPNAQRDPSVYGSGVTGVEELKRQRDEFVSMNTQYQNAAEDYAAVQGWADKNPGTVASYKSAKASYDAAEAELQALYAKRDGAKTPDVRALGAGESSAPVSTEYDEQIAAAVRKRDQAKMIMDYAYNQRYNDLLSAEDLDVTVDKGQIAWESFKQNEQTQEMQYDENGSPLGINEFSPYYRTNFADQNDKWTDDEKNIFYYLFATNRDAAFQYGYEVNQRYDAAEAAEKSWGTREFAQRDVGTGIVSSVLSVPASLFGGLYDYMNMAAENQARGGIYESQYGGWSNWAEDTRGSIAQKLNDYGTIDSSVPVLGGKGFGDLYQLFMSMADSSVAVMAGGGVANLAFFGSAAASATRQALDRGMDAGKAVALGFASGAAEVLGETLSVEHLLKQGDIADYLRNGLLQEMLKQGAVEGSEEVLTTLLNTLADRVINGDDREFQQNVYINMQNGMTYDEAVRKARVEWLEGLGADALGGFLSGGLMSGGRMGLQTATAAATNYTGDTQGLFDIANLTDEGSRSRGMAEQYQQRYNDRGSISNLQAAKLEVSALDELQAKDRPVLEAQAKQRLEALGVENADKAAKAVVDRVLGEEKGAVGKALDAGVFRDSRVRIAYQEMAEQLGGEQTSANWLNDKDLMTVGQDAAVGRTLDNRLKLVKLKGSDERVKIKNAEMQDGKLAFTYEQNGQDKTVSADDLEMDAYQRDAFDTLVEILGDDAAYAYNGLTARGLRSMDKYSIHQYATAFANIRNLFGVTGAKQEAALASPIRGNLTDAQVIQAYTLGKQKGERIRDSRPKSMRGTGKVTLDGGELDGVKLKAVSNPKRVKQSKLFQSVQAVAKALGIDVVMYESEADETGKLTGANGAYKDGVIYLDWNAGMSNIKDTSERMLFRTMSHELTHFIQQNSKEDYAELKAYVTKYLSETMGADFNDLVIEKEANQPGLSHDGAIDEVIADACETMLRDSQAVQDLMKESPGLGGKIRKWVLSFLRKITARDRGAEALQPVIADVQAIWDRGLRNAVESRPTAADPSDSVTDVTNEEGKTVAVADESTGGMQLSLRTYNEGGRKALRDFLDNRVKDGALTKDEASEIRKQMDSLYRVCKDFDNGKYAPFSAWSNATVVTYDGRPVFSVVKANGEYKLNLDFSLVCKKRRTLDAVFNEMIAQGILEDFDMVQESIAKINDIIRENGFETACGLCFVDAKRYRQGMIAGAFAMMYNTQVRSLTRKGAGQKIDYFNYGGDQTIKDSGAGIDTLPDDQLDWSKIDSILKSEKEGTVRWKIANYLKTTPSARRLVMRGDFMSTAGFDAVKAKNPELLKLYNSKKGAGGPKAAQSDVQYLNEIIQQSAFNEKAAYEVGGVRIQSFSDYVGRLVFDYVQMVGDLAAKKLPAHSYTKEFMYALQFGLTGIKINMSLVPEIIKGGVAPGLDANGDYAWKDGQSFGSTVYDNKGKRMTAAEGFELAKRIQDAVGYSKNCGTIAVGVSDAHILKMLGDPDIRMIIPYHKSSLNHIVASMMNIDKYDDYTLCQNTREYKNGKWVNIPKSQEFNFNEALQRLGDAKAAANEYLEWCRKNGYKPKFDGTKGGSNFSTHENYYKLLEDFSCYDKDGLTNAPMGAVQMKFPTASDAFGSMSDLIEQGLDEDAMLQAKQEKAVPEIVKQIQDVLPGFEAGVRERGKKGKKTAQLSARTDAKSDRELLLDADEAKLSDAERAARAEYKAKVDVFRQRQQAVTTALDALDKAVEAGDAAAANKQRAKVTAAEKKMSEALAVLTEAERGPELREILRREREIQKQRTTARVRDSFDRRELRRNVDKLWKDLNKRITSPTEKKNIPVPVMEQALDVLQAINMDTTKEGSERGQKLRDKLLELRSRYEALENDQDYRKAAVYDAQVAEFLRNMIDTVGDTPINRMSTQQLAAVYNTLRALEFTARKALKLKLGEEERSAYEISKQLTSETRSVGKLKSGLFDMWLNAGLSPARMFNRLGGHHKGNTWMQVYDMINAGQLKQTRLQVEGSMLFEDLMEAKDYEKFVSPKNTVDIGLKDKDGNAIEITHGMLVSLYMHLMNEQNRRHIAYGGMTIPGLKDYYSEKKVKGSEKASHAGGVLQEIAEINDQLREEKDPDVIAELEARRDEAGLRALTYLEELEASVKDKLTDYDWKWIAASRELFDGFSKRVLNETTMEVYGIKRANVENYFPIWVDGNFLNTPFESVAKDFSLENAGFMKERVDSSKPIRLADVSDVAASQIRKVAQYAGLMPVVRNFNKIWGKTQTGYRDSLRQAVMDTYGDPGVKYIENLMADLNGARNTDNSSLGEMFNRLRGHMAQASLTLSLRTAMGQAASYPTAAAVLGWDAIHQGLANYKKVDPELILKWSPLLKYRMKGYRDPELGNIAEMNSKWDRLWKKARWATGWIQAMDGLTVGQLVWSASEAYVQIHNKALQKGTDAYYEAVAKKFNEAVELTQPNYTTMQRPDILRNPNALVKQLTMFLTQRLQNFNIMYDAAATYSQMKKDRAAGAYGVTNEDVRQAGIQTRTAFLSQIVAAGTIVAFKYIADLILHSMNAYRDDDDEITAESRSLALLDMFFDSLAGNFLGGGELYDIIESKTFGKTYYGIEIGSLSSVTDTIDAAMKLYDAVATGKVSMKDLDRLAKKLSVLVGIPYANAQKIVNGVRWHVEDAVNGEFMSMEAGVDRTTGQQAHRLWRAYTAMDYGQVGKIREEVGDDDKLNQALAVYIKQQYADGEINRYEAQRQLVKYAGKDQEAAEKAMREYSSEVETGIKFSQIEDSFLLGDITASKAQQMLVKYGGLDAQTAKMKTDYWAYKNKNPGSGLEFTSYKTYVSKYQGIGLSVAQYENYYERLQQCKGVDADGDGKTDSGSKKAEVLALIDSMKLTPAQKDQLYYANNYGASGLKDTPWHK